MTATIALPNSGRHILDGRVLLPVERARQFVHWDAGTFPVTGDIEAGGSGVLSGEPITVLRASPSTRVVISGVDGTARTRAEIKYGGRDWTDITHPFHASREHNVRESGSTVGPDSVDVTFRTRKVDAIRREGEAATYEGPLTDADYAKGVLGFITDDLPDPVSLEMRIHAVVTPSDGGEEIALTSPVMSVIINLPYVDIAFTPATDFPGFKTEWERLGGSTKGGHPGAWEIVSGKTHKYTPPLRKREFILVTKLDREESTFASGDLLIAEQKTFTTDPGPFSYEWHVGDYSTYALDDPDRKDQLIGRYPPASAAQATGATLERVKDIQQTREQERWSCLVHGAKGSYFYDLEFGWRVPEVVPVAVPTAEEVKVPHVPSLFGAWEGFVGKPFVIGLDVFWGNYYIGPRMRVTSGVPALLDFDLTRLLWDGPGPLDYGGAWNADGDPVARNHAPASVISGQKTTIVTVGPGLLGWVSGHRVWYNFNGLTGRQPRNAFVWWSDGPPPPALEDPLDFDEPFIEDPGSVM